MVIFFHSCFDKKQRCEIGVDGVRYLAEVPTLVGCRKQPLPESIMPNSITLAEVFGYFFVFELSSVSRRVNQVHQVPRLSCE